MQAVQNAIESVIKDNVTTESLDQFRAAAVKFAEYGLVHCRGELLQKTLAVSVAMAEYANWFDETVK